MFDHSSPRTRDSQSCNMVLNMWSECPILSAEGQLIDLGTIGRDEQINSTVKPVSLTTFKGRKSDQCKDGQLIQDAIFLELVVCAETFHVTGQ